MDKYKKLLARNMLRIERGGWQCFLSRNRLRLLGDRTFDAGRCQGLRENLRKAIA